MGFLSAVKCELNMFRSDVATVGDVAMLKTQIKIVFSSLNVFLHYIYILEYVTCLILVLYHLYNNNNI